MSKAAAYWKEAYPDTAPVSWDLRAQFPHRWVRFHSLPGGKAEPESEKDVKIMTKRADTLAREALGASGPYYLLAYVYEPDPALPFKATQRWTYHGVALEQAYTCLEDHEPDASRIVVYAGETGTLGKAFISTVLGIAEGVSPRCAWASPQTGAAFAPYESGFDLVLKDPKAVKPFKDAHRKWLSKRQDGL